MAPATNEKVSNHIHIPDDVALSILSKLPLKSLKRFTSVRKSWTLLFQNPYFMNMFGKNFISAHNSLYDDTCLLLKQNVPRHGNFCDLYLLYGERFENKVNLEWPLPHQYQDSYEWPLHIVGSGINGILCIFDLNHETGVLWNPATEEFKHTHPSPAEFLPYNTTFFTLHGFGYDHVRDDYKVIRHVNIHRYFADAEVDWAYMPTRPGPLWEIYSVRTSSWRRLDEDIPIGYKTIGIEGFEVYLNGVCHWLGGTDDETYVVSFNLSNEVFFTTPLTLDMHDSFCSTKLGHRHLVMLNGSIAMISQYAKTASFHISILGELGIKESWAKLFIVGPLPCIQRPIGLGKKGDIFFRKEDDELVCFDLNTQTIEEIGVKGKDYGCQVAIYRKNPFPIGGISD